MLIGRIENAEIETQNLEDSLRAALIRTAFSDANLSSIPEGCSFTITIEVREDTDRPGGNVLTKLSFSNISISVTGGVEANG